MSLYQHARDGNAERLRDAMGSDSAAVRKRAAEFLGEVADHGDQPSIDVLLRAATGDEDAQVRGGCRCARRSVRRRSNSSSGAHRHQRVRGGGVTARKFARAQADRPELRMAAANALGRLDDGSGLQHLVEALDDEDARVRLRRVRPAWDLRRSACNPRADRAARRRAASPAGRRQRPRNIGTDRALSPLLDLLDDADESLRRIAAGALGRRTTPSRSSRWRARSATRAR